jgi:hypothetical protein
MDSSDFVAFDFFVGAILGIVGDARRAKWVRLGWPNKDANKLKPGCGGRAVTLGVIRTYLAT